LRLSKCTPRFETLLQTTRRTPLTEVDSLLPDINFEKFAADFYPQKPIDKKRLVGVKQNSTLFEAAASSFLFNDHTPAQLGLSGYKGSFFCRQYATQSIRTAGAISRFISRRSRLLASEQNAISTFVAVTNRYQLKSRTEARGRSSFTAHAR